MCIAAPAYVTDGSPEQHAHARDQLRWFGGMVGNHVADIVERYGDSGAVPQALTDYIKARKGYDYNEHGQAGNSHADFVPDEIVDRFCIIGPPEEHIRRLEGCCGVMAVVIAVQACGDHVQVPSARRREPCQDR
jgi:hypothetical protein